MSQPPAERKLTYSDHKEIEPEMVDYILSVADVDQIGDIDLEEINDYLNHMEQFYDEQHAQRFENLVHRSA